MQFLVILIVLIVAAVVIYQLHAAAERRKALSAWAHSRGMSFDPGKDRGMDERFRDFKALRRGHSRYARNIMRGTWKGLGVLAFDYHYATGSGKNRRNHNFSAVIVTAPLPLKPLYIRREGFFDKLGDFFGAGDIDFESAEFSRRFYVKSPDRKWAYDVIHTRMMEHLMAGPDYGIQFDTRHVMVWRQKRFSPAQLDQAAEFVRRMLELIPDYVVRQQSGT